MVERGVVTMECVAVGIPEPMVTWMKNDQIIELSSNPHLRVLNGGQVSLVLSHIILHLVIFMTSHLSHWLILTSINNKRRWFTG